ncbi:MAG: YeeE/YedE thiosulfate transporter family protein [Pelagibacteraceae bacterium]
MTIINFTPISSFLGGLLIGLAVVIFFIGNGRIAGISGITNNLLFSKTNRLDNLLFILGIILGPILIQFFTGTPIPFVIETSLVMLVSAGLLVGVGTAIGGGCTSGHGVCGISRLSSRSIVATLLFMSAAILTVLFKGMI